MFHEPYRRKLRAGRSGSSVPDTGGKILKPQATACNVLLGSNLFFLQPSVVDWLLYTLGLQVPPEMVGVGAMGV